MMFNMLPATSDWFIRWEGLYLSNVKTILCCLFKASLQLMPSPTRQLADMMMRTVIRSECKRKSNEYLYISDTSIWYIYRTVIQSSWQFWSSFKHTHTYEHRKCDLGSYLGFSVVTKGISTPLLDSRSCEEWCEIDEIESVCVFFSLQLTAEEERVCLGFPWLFFPPCCSWNTKIHPFIKAKNPPWTSRQLSKPFLASSVCPCF